MYCNYRDIRTLRVDDFTPLFYAISRISPHLGAVTSFLNAAHDIYDFMIHICKSDVRGRSIILKTTFGKFFSNSVIGLANMTPIICVAAILLINPVVLPLITIHPISMDFIKFATLVKKGMKEVREKKLKYLIQPTKNNLDDLLVAKNYLYQIKQELVISAGLIIGAILSVVGVFFPPLLLVGIILSISIAVAGFVDKRYQCSSRMHQFFFGKEEFIPYAPSIIPVKMHASMR